MEKRKKIIASFLFLFILSLHFLCTEEIIKGESVGTNISSKEEILSVPEEERNLVSKNSDSDWIIDENDNEDSNIQNKSEISSENENIIFLREFCLLTDNYF